MTAELSDLEICWACAKAIDMGCYEVDGNKPEHTIRINGRSSPHNNYWPLTDKAQAMDLVYALKISISFSNNKGGILAKRWDLPAGDARHPDLLRAICLCASKIQLSKEKANV